MNRVMNNVLQTTADIVFRNYGNEEDNYTMKSMMERFDEKKLLYVDYRIVGMLLRTALKEANSMYTAGRYNLVTSHGGKVVQFEYSDTTFNDFEGDVKVDGAEVDWEAITNSVLYHPNGQVVGQLDPFKVHGEKTKQAIKMLYVESMVKGFDPNKITLTSYMGLVEGIEVPANMSHYFRNVREDFRIGQVLTPLKDDGKYYTDEEIKQMKDKIRQETYEEIKRDYSLVPKGKDTRVVDVDYLNDLEHKKAEYKKMKVYIKKLIEGAEK